MSKLHLAVVGLAFAAIAGAPAAADGYVKAPNSYGYAPGPEIVEAPADVVYSYSEIRVRYRGAPAYGYGPAYLPGPPDLWRQREVAYDAIFTKDKRVIYDAGLAAQSRAATEYYAAPRFYSYGPAAYYRAPGYGSIKDFGPPPVGFAGPVIDPAGTCGTFRYWDGASCVDARYYSRYKNPYEWRYLRK